MSEHDCPIRPFASHFESCAFVRDLRAAASTAELQSAARRQCDCGFDIALAKPDTLDVYRLARALCRQHDDYRCGGPRWHEVEAAAIVKAYEADR